MGGNDGEIIVGILGQWASGKSAAARTLVDHLGGRREAIFITDRILLARQAVNHILELEESKISTVIEAGGRQQIKGELATVFLGPGEDLQTVDLDTLLFDLDEDVYDKVPVGEPNWLDIVRLQLGAEILEKSREGKPIVIEAGFGSNNEPRGENPFRHTLSDLFTRLDEAGVEPGRIRWIIVEADFGRRSARNDARQDSVPAIEFNRFASDGGDLNPDEQRSLEERGTIIRRIHNNHNDIDKFKKDIITAYNELYAG